MEPLAAPLPNLFEKKTNNNIDTYACSKCSSNIEIESINDKEAVITFKCLNNNENNNHQIQTLPIKEYLENMDKNTYLYDECAICLKIQSSDEHIFKYCIKCKETICNDCEELHLNNNNIEGHFLINNNEKSIKCLFHEKENNFIDYCFDCKKHLCKECLMTKKHINHYKNSLFELQITEENKIVHNKIIDYLKVEKNKLNELKNIIIKDENKIKNEYQEKLNTIDIELNDELLKKEKNYKNELEELEKIKQKLENQYKCDIENIKDKYNKIKTNIEIAYNEELKENAIKNKNKNELNKKINNLNDLISINEILKNTQEKYDKNYHYNENINNVINSFKNSENEEIKNLFKKTENLDNSKEVIEINIDDIDKDKKFLSKKLKSDNDIFSKDLEESLCENKEINNNNVVDEDYNKSNNKIEDENIDIKEDINSSYNEEINNKELMEENTYKSDLNNNLNIIGSDIIDDSYCCSEYGDSFIVFTSINKNSYIVYATKERSIICYNLVDNKIERKHPNAHKQYISHFSYCYNSKINKELIMSVSFSDANLKIWYFQKWQCIANMKDLYFFHYLYTARFLDKINNYYIVTANGVLSNLAEPIRIYDYHQNIIKVIKNSKYKATSLQIHSNNCDTYIIAGNEDNIRSYDYNKSNIYKIYISDISCKLLNFSVYKNRKENIITSCDDHFIRIWDFHTSRLINKIEFENIKLDRICLYNEHYLLAGSDDNSIKIIDISKGEIIKSLDGHKGKICTIKTKSIPDYGKYIFSHSKDNYIKLWEFQ